MDPIVLKRLLYKNRHEIIADLDLDESMRCTTCLIHEASGGSFYEYCNGCECNHDTCIDCDMMCHNNCSCNFEHQYCEDDCPIKSGKETKNICHHDCKNIYDTEKLIYKILKIAFFKEGISLLEKYISLFNIENPEEIYIKLLRECMKNKYDNYNEIRKNKYYNYNEIRKNRFNEILTSKKINMSFCTDNLLSVTDDEYYLDKILEHGYNIDTLSRGYTNLEREMYGIVSVSNTTKKFEYLLKKGADINKVDITILSGIQYIDRPIRKEHIKYFIMKGLNVENRLIDHGKKMLYDTRLGVLLQELEKEQNEQIDMIKFAGKQT